MADISTVASLFCSVLGLQRARLTLQALTSAVCNRWHSDKVTARACRSKLIAVRGLVTFCGAGTEFLDDRDADRRELQRFLRRDTGGFGVRRNGAVHRAAAGDLLLLKGHSYAGNAGRGAVHRSPEASPCAPRLLIVLDDILEFQED
ncbi:hypothetical protein WJX81_003087 [Elliptochloris bilobata]|uniref:DUF1826 domain-containing protein n=1 Tax=Elliptochloris bilobata TaxID=381761 RepID=A0AAW1SG57_9CHLO